MKRYNDLISVIIPVFNAEKWLKRCVDSVVNQTYQNNDEINLIESLKYRFDLSYSHITICGCMFARSLLAKNGEILTFSEDIIRCEDILFMANIVKRASTILASNQKLYFVSKENPLSLTKSKDAAKIVDSISMWLAKMKEVLNGEYLPVYRSIYDWIPVTFVAMINAFCDTGVFYGKAYTKAKK